MTHLSVKCWQQRTRFSECAQNGKLTGDFPVLENRGGHNRALLLTALGNISNVTTPSPKNDLSVQLSWFPSTINLNGLS